jgi:hypothetical protein
MIFDFSEDFKSSTAVAAAAGSSASASNTEKNRKRRNYDGRGDRSPLKAIKLNDENALPVNRKESIENYVVSKENVSVNSTSQQQPSLAEDCHQQRSESITVDDPFTATWNAEDGDLSLWISNELLNIGIGSANLQSLDSSALTIVQTLLKEVIILHPSTNTWSNHHDL